MANSLQDQLRKAGLVNDKQLKKAQSEQRKEQKSKQHAKSGDSDAATSQAQRALAEKAERDRGLNRQRKEAEEKKALAAQVKQLIQAHQVAQGNEEVKYNFVDAGKVKSLWVANAVRDQIARGRLAVVQTEGAYALVPAEIAEKIRGRDPTCVVLLQDATTLGSIHDDDPYADYAVPDDLTW